MASIYQQLKTAGIELDNHESDLYAKVTPESRVIVGEYGGAPVFISQIDGALWYEIPAAFDPFWIARATAHGETVFGHAPQEGGK